MEDEMEEIPWDVINLLACCMFISFTTCASEYKAQPAVLIIQMQIKLKQLEKFAVLEDLIRLLNSPSLQATHMRLMIIYVCVPFCEIKINLRRKLDH